MRCTQVLSLMCASSTQLASRLSRALVSGSCPSHNRQTAQLSVRHRHAISGMTQMLLLCWVAPVAVRRRRQASKPRDTNCQQPARNVMHCIRQTAGRSVVTAVHTARFFACILGLRGSRKQPAAACRQVDRCSSTTLRLARTGVICVCLRPDESALNVH